MDAVKLDEVSGGGGANRSRREALKKFGRYAAAAPTAMILLQARDGYAAEKRPGRGRRGKGNSPY